MNMGEALAFVRNISLKEFPFAGRKSHACGSSAVILLCRLLRFELVSSAGRLREAVAGCDVEASG